MDKDERRAFLRWAEEASDEELEMKSVQLTAFISTIRQSDARADAQWLMRVIQREITARREIRS